MTIDNLPIQMVKITGTPGGGYWSQIHSFTPDEPQKNAQRGTLLASVMVKTDKQGVDAVSYGRDILGRLHEEYFGNTVGSAYDCLKKAVEQVSAEAPESQIAIAVILNSKVLLATSKGATVWLKRGDEFGQLMLSENGVESLAGDLVENDTYLLSSSVFNEAVPVGTLKIALSSDLEQAGEMVGPMVLGHEQSGGAVGLFFRVNKIPVADGQVEFEKAIVPVFAGGPAVDQGARISDNDRPVKEIYLKSVRLRRTVKKFLPALILIIAVFLVVLGVSKVFGGVSQARREAKGKALVATLKTEVDKLSVVKDSEPEKLKEQVIELNKLVNQIDALKITETSEYQEIKKAMGQINDQSDQVGYIKEPVVYMDLSLVDDGVEGGRIITSGNKLVVLSQDGKELVVFDSLKKAYQKYPLEADYVLMATDNNKTYLASKTNIVEVNLTNGKTINAIKGGLWEGVDGFSVYLGNLYLLDKNKSAIWRFLAVEGGFGVGKNWLKEEVDLSKSVDMQADGSVWLLDKDNLRRFNLGKADSFTVSDEKFNLVDAGFLVTSVESKELLVLDKDNGRVYRVGKDGKLVRTYQSPVFKNAVGLASDSKKAYILDGKKIYEIGLE